MKKISVVDEGTGEIYDVEIEREDKARHVMSRLGFIKGELKKLNCPQEEHFSGNDLLYRKVSDGEELRFHCPKREMFSNQKSKKGGDSGERNKS